MLDEQRNRQLMEVGPDKPMGKLLRRYWHPIAAASEFETKNTKLEEDYKAAANTRDHGSGWRSFQRK